VQHGIREFRPRQPLDRQLSSDTLNRILRELESLRITRVVNGTFKKLPGGTEIVVAPQRGGGGSSAESHPFQITSFVDPDSEPESPSYLVTVRPGTLNTLLPTNTFDDGGLSKLSLTKDTMKNVVLTAESDGRQFVSCSLSLDSTAPDPQEPALFELPSTVKFLLGVVYNSSVHQLVRDNIAVTGKVQLTTDKAAPAQPGQLPYDIFYVWG
jgi:hypothetical protein